MRGDVINSPVTSSAISPCLCRITWDTPVRELVGDWYYFKDGYRSNETTSRDILSHRLGLARHDGMWGFGGMTMQDILEYDRGPHNVRVSILFPFQTHPFPGYVRRISDFFYVQQPDVRSGSSGM